MRSKAEAAAFFDDCEREMRAKDAGCIISGLMMRAIKRESTGIDDSALTTKLTLQTPLTEISMNFTQDIPHPRSTEFAGTNSRMKTPLKRQHDNAEEAFDGPRRSSRLKKLKAKSDAGSAISPIEGGEARARDYTKTTLCQSISATYFVRPSTPVKTSRKSTRKENPPAKSYSSLGMYSLRSRGRKSLPVATNENIGATSSTHYTGVQ